MLQFSLAGLVGSRQLDVASFDQPLRASGHGPLSVTAGSIPVGVWSYHADIMAQDGTLTLQ